MQGIFDFIEASDKLNLNAAAVSTAKKEKFKFV